MYPQGRKIREIFFDMAKVKFAEMTDAETDQYVASGECRDKAGAYAIQGYASLWINGIEGEYFNVVGLPIKKLSDTLKKEFDIRLS